MTDVERLAAENARLKAILSKQGFKFVYSPKTGEIRTIVSPRKPTVQHTAVTWAKKRGYKGSMGIAKAITKNRKITLRKFKKAVERGEAIKHTQNYLKQEGYLVHQKFFNKIPTYILKNNAFYENLNYDFRYANESENDAEFDDAAIRKSINKSVDRIKKANKKVKSTPKIKL
jgi:hypothetical protein